MQKSIISFLSCILILVSTNSFARDKQPRRFNFSSGTDETTQTSSAPIPTRQKMGVDERLQRLERLMNSQGLVDLLLKLDNLQKEVQQLRGDVELQTHTVTNLKKRQRDLYVDIDRRLLQIERNTPNNGNRSNSNSRAYSNGADVAQPEITAPTVNSTTQPSPVRQVAPAPVVNRSVSRSIDPVKEQNAYQKAFDLLRELRYEQAIKAYRQFIRDYPNGRYAHIAQYWLSEASYAQRHFKQAIKDYQDLITNYPNSPKLAEAMLKISYSYNALGQNRAAQEMAEKLLRVYPNTTAAGQAQNLLKKIKSARR